MIEAINLSIVIEQIFAFYLLIIGISLIFYQKSWTSILSKVLKTEDSMMACGMKELLVGLIIVAFHNIWTYSYAVIVTLVAWGMIIEGSLILLAPKFYKNIVPYFYKKSIVVVLSLIMLVISGIIFTNIQNFIM